MEESDIVCSSAHLAGWVGGARRSATSLGWPGVNCKTELKVKINKEAKKERRLTMRAKLNGLVKT